MAAGTVVELTADLLQELFEYRDGALYNRVARSNKTRIGERAGTINMRGYVQISIGGKLHYEHRLVWLMHHGYMPAELDHINRNQADNRIENLRAVTHAQNMWNAPMRKGRPVRGTAYYARTKGWDAQIYKNGKRIYLGRFRAEEDAHEAYLSAKDQLHILGGN